MDDSWIYFEGKRNGLAYMANVRHPLVELREPDSDHHVAVTLPYKPNWRTGLPKPDELTRLQDYEDRTIANLQGHGVLAGSETCDAKRTVHLYVRDGRIVEMFRRKQSEGKLVRVTHDPEWRAIDHFARVSAQRAEG